MLFHGINVVSLSVPDLDAARDFYGRVLGFGAPLYDLPQIGWLEFGTGGAGNLAVTTNDPHEPPQSRTTVVLKHRGLLLYLCGAATARRTLR